MLLLNEAVSGRHAPFVRRAQDCRAEIYGAVLRKGGRVAGGLARAASRAMGRGIAAIARWRRRRQAIRQLERLPDRLLGDIGISRGQIPGVVTDQLSRPHRRAEPPDHERPRDPALASHPGLRDGGHRALRKPDGRQVRQGARPRPTARDPRFVWANGRSRSAPSRNGLMGTARIHR